MTTVFASSWMILRVAGVGEPVAFVWAGVLAQAVQMWGVLPVTVWRQRHVFGRARKAVIWAMTILFGFLAFQIWWSDPRMSQRVVSIYCAFYAGFVSLGIWGDRDIMNSRLSIAKDSKISLGFRRHLLKLYAIAAILVIAVNESLLIVDAPLGTRVIVLSLLPVALHYFFEITLLLTCPPLEESDT